MLKVFYIVGELGRGGQEQQLMYLLENLNFDLYDKYLVVWNYEDKYFDRYRYIENLGVKTFRFHKGDKTLYKVIRLCKILRKNNVDIIHSFTFSKNFYAYLGSLLNQAIPIGALRSSFNFNLINHSFLVVWLNSFFPKTIISNNNNGAYELKKYLPSIVPKKYYVVTNKLDLSKFEIHPFPAFDTIRSISIGRLSEEKRIDLIIAVVERAVNTGLNVKHYHLGDGHLRDEINLSIKNKNLEKYFVLLGEKANITTYLGNSHFLIHASDHEGMPNVVMEAMACGRPVISTECGDIKFLIHDRHSGFIVPKQNFNSLFIAYKKLALNPELCVKFGKSARIIAESKLDVIQMVEETNKIYNELLSYSRH